MRFSKTATITALALATSAVASLAQAVPIDIWNYSVTTSFTGVNTFSSGGGTQIQTATQVSWGATGGNVFVNTGNPDTNRSGITISDIGPGANDPTADPVTGQVVTGATTIPGIGLTSWITHHNNPISGAYATLLTGQIRSVATFTPNTPPIGGSVSPPPIFFDIFFAETPNATPCTVTTSPTPCNDIFALNPSQAFNQTFVFDGVTYFASIFPVSGGGLSTFQPLSAAECAATGANAGCVGFTTVEGQDTTVQFGFAITAQPLQVPEPASLALFGLALGALGLMRRRRSV